MSSLITREQLERFAVNSADMLQDLISKETAPKRHSEPYAKRVDGRKRRKARKHVRRAKAAWLYS